MKKLVSLKEYNELQNFFAYKVTHEFYNSKKFKRVHKFRIFKVRLKYKIIKILHDDVIQPEASFDLIVRVLFLGKERLWYKLYLKLKK